VLRLLEGNILRPYFDKKGIPTIGIGLNLDDADVRVRVYDAMKIPDELRARLDELIRSPSTRARSADGSNPIAGHFSVRDNLLRDSLNAFLLNSTAHRAFVLTADESLAAFSTEVVLREPGVIGTSNVPSATRELLALLSLEYNGIYNESDNLKKALNANPAQRAEAWYEIRYSHKDELQKRRFIEAALFGLYGENVAPADQLTEAFDVYRMYTSHGRSRTQSGNYLDMIQ
jgi:GH24 family phage-related lysozyme (muramidase)